MRVCQILLSRCHMDEPKSLPNVAATNEYQPKHWCDVQIFVVPPLYHLPGNVVSAAVGLMYINLQPEYELPSSTRLWKISEVWKNLSWGTDSSHP